MAARRATAMTLQHPRGLSSATRCLNAEKGFIRPSQLDFYRNFSRSATAAAPGSSLLSALTSSPNSPSTYFQKPSLPANTVIRFVPQQTAWIVERMGKFNRILEPGLAVLIPFLDRIAYVKSLKETAIEIPSQSAITADNVTLDLDGVLYTRVFDAYKARYALCIHFAVFCLQRIDMQHTDDVG